MWESDRQKILTTAPCSRAVHVTTRDTTNDNHDESYTSLHERDDDRARSRRKFHSTLKLGWRFARYGPPKNLQRLHDYDVQNRRKQNKKEISENQEQCWIPHFSFFLLLSSLSVCLSLCIFLAPLFPPLNSGKRRRQRTGKDAHKIVEYY